MRLRTARFVRKALLMGLGILSCVILAGCVNGISQPTPGSNSTTKNPSSSPTLNLLEPGKARTAVNDLVNASSGKPIIRVTVTKHQATLTFVQERKARTLGWTDGQISVLDSDVEYVRQSTFNPANFALDDVARLFSQAAKLSGSQSNQELQINEVNSGSIYMSVSTEPESSTVFFRPDGSLIRPLDLTKNDDLNEALKDALEGRDRVISIGYRSELGLWADFPAGNGIIERRTRPTKLPPYSAKRTGSSNPITFTASSVKVDVISQLMRELPGRLGKPGTTTVNFTIEQTSQSTPALIHFDVGGTKFVTTLEGKEIKGS